MSGQFYEVLKDGQPTSQLFFTEDNAQLWITTHGGDGATYSVRPYKQGEG